MRPDHSASVYATAGGGGRSATPLGIASCNHIAHQSIAPPQFYCEGKPGGPIALAYWRAENSRIKDRPNFPNIRGCANPSPPGHWRPPKGLNYCAHG